jgi:hypothetical protein
MGTIIHLDLSNLGDYYRTMNKSAFMCQWKEMAEASYLVCAGQ